jgi:hypothetical protein
MCGNRAEAEVVCRRIADALSPPFVIREISISTSASIGVAFCPEDAEDANALLKNADLAMYHAKEFGSGAYQFFTEAMGVRRTARNRRRAGAARGAAPLRAIPRLPAAGRHRQRPGHRASRRWCAGSIRSTA